MTALVGCGGPRTSCWVVPVAQAFGSGTTQQLVLAPPYTSSAVIGGADVLLPNWSQILPLVHRYFPAA